MFELHPKLKKDTFPVLDLSVSTLLLMNDARFPWVILVPARPAIVEITDLSDADYTALADDVRRTSRAMQQLFNADKMNIAALGNMVPQLHVHVIARFRTDEAWPRPVWGVGTERPYTPETAGARVREIAGALEL